MKPFRYILRYYIDPGYREEERIAELIAFCREARVDEVMLFFNAEELNTGHVTLAELASWLAMAKKLKAELAANGVGLSVNPWTTTVHSPRGRVLKPGQNFTLMVGETGQDNGVTTCPMCPEWLAYICELWAAVARELKPSAIWIEDDWRYHNHGRALGFGGCFCELHLAEFSRRIGRPVGREELIANVFAAGEPHPWRAVWMKLNGESMTAPIRRIREAVQLESPETRIALMCGGIDVNSIEGRDWHSLQDAAGFQDAFMVRPTISPYTEVWSMRQYPVQARMIGAVLKRPLEICPEMESGPRHGAYSKGCAFAGWVIEQTACFGAHAITINHYDMLGCGIAIDTRFAATLRKLRPRLDAVRALGLDDDDSRGANILISPQVAATFRSAESGQIEALGNRSGEWGCVAEILGFSHRFTTRIEPSPQPVLVSNQTLNAFSDDDVRQLLSGSVVLDGTAAAGLIARGMGELIGLAGGSEHCHNVSGFSYEEIPETDAAVYGVANPRMTMQRACRTLREFTPLDGCKTLTLIRRYDHAPMFGGAFLFRNRLGGRVATLCSPLGDGGDSEWFYMGYFNCFRRIFLHRLLRECAPEMAGAFVEELPFQCHRVAFAGGEFLAALNSTSDVAEHMVMRVTAMPCRTFELLDDAGNWLPDAVNYRELPDGSLLLTVEREIPIHGSVMIRAR